MSTRKAAEVFPPGEFIRDELEERGWTQTDLAKIIGRPLPTISLIISGKKAVTPETAIELSEAFGTSPDFWLNLETAYRLSKASSEDGGAIRERARLFEMAPVKDMEKRGWIKAVSTVEELRSELSGFFSLLEVEKLRMAARTSIESSELNTEQLAWCVRALRLAQSVPVRNFTSSSLRECISQLRALTDFPENIRHVPRVLGEAGIRFVVVEDLPKSKIDGAALWLGDAWDKPVIALSLRYDRIDSFWHTLFHEVSHVENRDTYIVDVDLVSPNRCLSDEALSEIEKRANADAAKMLIPSDSMQAFIRRTKPFYSSAKIIQFANLMKIHPGIIAGQLQFKKEIDWAVHRKMLVKVRDILVSGALTDGYATTIPKRHL
jgi:HTH-type transcriptional regulator/antitoxin HigA